MTTCSHAVCAFALLLSLTGCGQTGDLYWPDEQPTVVEEEQIDPESR